MSESAGTAGLAFITTLHCALMLLRNYRSAKTAKLAVLPSIVFMASPWFLPAPVWLVGGFVSHIAWFAACERFLPKPAVSAATASPPPPRAMRSPGFQPVAVLATFDETAEIRTFRLARPPGFAFQAGQFALVRVSIDGRPVIRCYSITSAPAISGYLEISVRNQGIVSRHLHETLRPGMTIELNGPGGEFVYPAGEQPIVLLAGGIGITPLLSMLRHALIHAPSRPITLVLSAQTAAHVPFGDELQGLARRHPQFRMVIALSRGTPDGRFHSGRIDRNLIERAVPRPLACVYMICGPLGMIEDLRHVLEAMGVPAAQIHFEKFEAAVSLAGGASSLTRARVTLRRSRRTLDVAAGQTILEAANAAGESLPSLCGVGVCGTCRTRLISGKVDGDFDAIDASEQADGYILACVARPLEDCVIDA